MQEVEPDAGSSSVCVPVSVICNLVVARPFVYLQLTFPGVVLQVEVDDAAVI